MSLADAHIHLFRDSPGADRSSRSPGGRDLTEYELLRRTHGIDRALVVGFEGTAQHVGNNAHIIQLSDARDWIVPLAYLPVWPAPSRAELQALIERGFRGVAVWIGDVDAADAVSRWPSGSRRAIADLCTVVSLNARAELTARIVGFATALAPAAVLFSHLGLPGRFAVPINPDEARERLSALLSLSGSGHIGVKQSGLYAVSEPRGDYPHRQAWPFVDVLFEAFGPDRMYWGSDFRPATNWVPFDRTVDVYLPQVLSQEEIAMVMGGNLMRLTGGRP